MTTLIIIDQPPYGNWAGREGLDMAFSLAAFDQPVALLFTGAGVNWLRQGQQAELIAQKNVDRNLSAATVFGVDQLLADSTSLTRFGLAPVDLLAGVETVRFEPALLSSYSHVVCP
ncbi:DsrE family protein [Marinobacter sp. X15-166B]|uniref:DsrE family protein n=1 Tax=Marinobacter sp. X15-166B TaxID=1897620 RepID=UPI00085C454B|nr:DsrE family protein [Marinobacter sp. X15-166B]OEY67673.1 sulfur reduction protein DsrE [Marinobacter sp. X15-166B]